MTEIRAFAPQDAPAVAALFYRIFRPGTGAASPALAERLSASFLDHPWFDPEMPSWISVTDGGSIQGFLGTYPIRMVLNDRPVRAAAASSFMVESPDTDPWIGARLVRSFINGPQDLSLCLTANAISATIWDRLGAHALGTYSLDWIRVFNPTGAMLAWLVPRFRLAAAAKPLGIVADRFLASTRLQDFMGIETVSNEGVEGREASDDEFVEAALALSVERRLRPAWRPDVLGWLLSQANEKDHFGPLFRRVVRGPQGRLLGAYLVYVRAGQIARVLQILAREHAVEATLDDLFGFVAAKGAAAVRGQAEPMLFRTARSRRCIFFSTTAALAHTRSDEILHALHAGSALVTGLAGETWSPLIGNKLSVTRDFKAKAL